MHAAEFDENLILRIGEGDGDAFRELYQQTQSAVYGFALSILRNRQDAEDVMHDTYIRAYQGAVSYTPRGKPMAWIMTIVKNLCYNRLKSGKVCEDIDQYEHIATVDGSENALNRIALEKALQMLSFEERQIVILHALTGMKHREIAEMLDMPTGTVLSKYNRAIRKVSDELRSVEGKEELR